MKFKDIAIAGKFRSSKSRGAGASRDTMMWQEWEKISKSQARCTGQFGYSNTRAVGSTKTFGAFATVWNIGE